LYLVRGAEPAGEKTAAYGSATPLDSRREHE
jgi:hypothetical protein